MTSHGAADTIAAISTPLGEAGIGIVRLSGPRAFAIARRLFRPHRSHSTWQSHRLYLGHIVDPQDEIIDEVMVTLMRAPYTYTREDVVEINCHSGYGVLRRILDLALAAGARLARPGEFTLRAFLSGRLDLTQAEAVLEVIRARTETHLQVAAAHLKGGLGRRLSRVRQDLLDL
ncbi:MAG: tRNA uridine-5-carboxymethylaminomethyl(34) synthesis GTPase MnmE, partial [Proteobacteria bacterium]|nr:tRNA uridine-5-carboxymethylaminomethyl(34) synthesis GTPase MnmE [Pseudomonadota bacterium]